MAAPRAWRPARLRHLLGAAGGLEAGITALAVYNQIAPPTINLDHPDEACDLDYIPNRAREQRVAMAFMSSTNSAMTSGVPV